MYAATGGPNVKWGEPISNGVVGHHCPPAGDVPECASAEYRLCSMKPLDRTRLQLQRFRKELDLRRADRDAFYDDALCDV